MAEADGQDPSEPGGRGAPPPRRAPNPIVHAQEDTDDKLSMAKEAAAKREATESLREGLGRQVELKAQRLRGEQAARAHERRCMDVSAAQAERTALAERTAHRQLCGDNSAEAQQEAESRRAHGKARKDTEVADMRRLVAPANIKDRGVENREHASRRQGAAAGLQEASYQMYQRSVADPEQARMRAEAARLDRDEAGADRALGALMRDFEESRGRQRHQAAATQARQVEEQRQACEGQAAGKLLERETVNAQVTMAVVAEARRRRKARARGVQAQQDLAAAIAEKVARHPGCGARAGPALATMHSSPELSREVMASRFLDKPMGRPAAPPAARKLAAAAAASAPDLQASAGLEPIGASWSHGLSPEARRAALEAARRREAAAQVRRRDW